ncbi:MAG: GntR family transcriptional regulator, partial [Bauldia sp.]|nr:GntR family transcriptional regulator [Bauldia sp.]
MAAVQAHIRSNHLAPGDVLPSENAIAEQMDISRAVVREAFRSMAALKLIDVGNGRRARVSAMDPSVLALVLGHVVQTN